ncbi:MAG: ABC transporter ATP-binding protein [Candidatus Woesearchaeota archaeon]
MGKDIFRVQKVTKAFGSRVILDNINLDIVSGEIIGLIGASGTGKTTLLNTLIGFLRPEEGDVLFRRDHLLSTSDSEIFRSVFQKQQVVKQVYGFASQVPSFYGDLTTQENLKYFGNLHNLSKDAINSNVKTLLELMELKDAHDVKAKKLSGGMERRLDIACALMHDPDVLILDEPTADLDPLLRNHIWELIRKINKKGTTIILSSHHLNELESLCDRVAFLKNGKLAAVGAPDKLKEDFVLDQEIALQTKEREYEKLTGKLKHKDIKDIKVKNNFLLIYTQKPEVIIEHALKTIRKEGQQLTFINITNASLDDVFITIWKKKAKDKEAK